MDDDVRYIVGGAAAGAVIGALVAWLYKRYSSRQEVGAIEGGPAARPVDRGRLLRVGFGTIGLIRQILDL